MAKRKRTIISVILFAVVFAALLITATFTDFQVSAYLTSSSLSEHTYYTNAAYPAAFEIFGYCPMYLMLAFAFEILFLFGARSKTFSKFTKVAFSAIALICSLIFNFVFFNEIKNGMLRHLERYDAISSGYIILVVVFLAILFSFCSILAVNNFSDNSLKRLVGFAFATILLSAVSTEIVDIIKGPVGRIRFRAMNMYPDSEEYGFAKFARWYEVNGQWIEKDKMVSLFGTSDALRSFPSGHTSQAGCTYALIMLNDALDIKNKKLRAFFWILPVLITGSVAVSRIVAGAHFFSDVLMGGTISFVCMIILREIFILKGSHFKSK